MSTPNNNSKSILAKVLATENISVQFSPSAKTAAFDIANRVLTVPILKDNEKEFVTDMFIGHECAHALFSPYREKDYKSKGNWWIEAEEIGGTGNAPYVQDIMNIVEDVRIEKLMTEKFPGLRRDFSAAYRELHDRDFFATKGQDIKTFNFVDRLNLHFKCGAYLNIQFSEKEQRIVDMIAKMNSHTDMVNIAREIFEFIGGSKYDSPMVKTNNPGQMGDGGEGDGESLGAESENGGSNENPESQQSRANQLGEKGGTGHAADNLLPPIRTQAAFDKRKNELVNHDVQNSTNVTLPVPDLNRIVFPIKRTHEVINSYYTNFARDKENGKLYSRMKTSYADLIKSINPLINTLIKQFEMKKAADLQKRTSVSRSGKIDCDRIFKYKVTDDIFSRFSKITEGKNHGLVMYVDWSSSMQPCTDDVLVQVIMLTQFCRRMNIPFDVYLFSSQFEMMRSYGVLPKNGDYSVYKDRGRTVSDGKYGKLTENEAANTTAFSLIHVLSSSMSKHQMNDAMFNVYLLGKMITGAGEEFSEFRYARRGIPSYFGQGNTPLDPTILAAMYMVPEFQQKHKVQIMNTIFLTDGDSGYGFFNSVHPNDGYYAKRHRSVVRCPINNKEYVADDATATDTLLRMFREVTGSTAIGFHITAGGYCRYVTEDSKTLKKQLKELGYVEAKSIIETTQYDPNTNSYKNSGNSVKNHGYDRLFILPTKVEITDTLGELDSLDNNASLTRIRNTFLKSVEKRGNSRLFLNRFADVIANPNTK